MKNTAFIFAFASVLLLSGCSETRKKDTISTAPVNFSEPAAAQASPGTAAPATSGSVTLNPPHGEPGHRCDIQVGQPLNTPAPTPGSSTQPAVAAPTFTPPPASGTVAAGMNPPHGQPGHDCAVPVGAPLNK